MNTVAQLLSFATKELKTDKRINNVEFEASYILSEVLKVPRLQLALIREKLVNKKEQEKIENAILERVGGKPLQYIFSETEFLGLVFKVSQKVLIPRIDTEFLIDRVATDIKEIFLSAEGYLDRSGFDRPNIKVLDIGTGSGVIAICLKSLIPCLDIDAVDISQAAIKIAKQNAANNEVLINFFVSDLFVKVSDSYDVIVSNPPYISAEEYLQLPDEIIQYEPESALRADEQGAYFYRRILDEASSYLKPNGKIYFEIGSKQALKVKRLSEKAGYRITNIDKDYADLDRVITIEKA